MKNITHKELFKCILCKKFRHYSMLESIFEDGSFLCKICGDEIRGSFSYYIAGEHVSQKEFKDKTKGG